MRSDMKTRYLVVIATLLAPLSCAGSTRAHLGVKGAHDAGEGTTREFDGSLQQLWDASHAVMKWNPVGAVEDHEAEHYFVTSPNTFDQVGVWLEPAGSAKTKVSVVVIDDPNLPGPNEQGVLNDIDTALTLEKNGQSTDKRP